MLDAQSDLGTKREGRQLMTPRHLCTYAPRDAAEALMHNEPAASPSGTRSRMTQQGAAGEKDMLRLADGIRMERCMVVWWYDAGSGIEVAVANDGGMIPVSGSRTSPPLPQLLNVLFLSLTFQLPLTPPLNLEQSTRAA